MKYKVSLTMPAIRTNNWEKFYESSIKACKKNSYEIVIVSPFDLPKSLQNCSNIKIIKDYGNPSRATQIANINAEGEFIYNCVDDGIFFENCIDIGLDYFDKNLSDNDVLNMRYREQAGRVGYSFPLNFWKAHYHNELRLPGIDKSWNISLHFLMKRKKYIELGGIDCIFEYSNHGIHDMIFRLQANGGKVVDSPIEGLNCDHYPEKTGDHGPIHDAQVSHDLPLFNSIYMNSKAAFERHIELDNWKNCDEVWNRRFSKKISSYEELNG